MAPWTRQHAVIAVVAFGIGMVFHELLAVGMGAPAETEASGSGVQATTLAAKVDHNDPDAGGGPSPGTSIDSNLRQPQGGPVSVSPVYKTGQDGSNASQPERVSLAAEWRERGRGMQVAAVVQGLGDAWYGYGNRSKCDPLPPLPASIPCGGPDQLRQPSQ
jgi:hypothetical protein